MSKELPLNPHGKIKTFIDNVEINEVRMDGVPIPDVNRKRATLEYNIVKNDDGQLIVDQATYGKHETHKYKVVIGGDQIYEFDGVIYDYKIGRECMLTQKVYIRLNGHFLYSRDGKIEIRRDFLAELLNNALDNALDD